MPRAAATFLVIPLTLLSACQSTPATKPSSAAQPPATPAKTPEQAAKPRNHDAQSTVEPRSEPGEGQKLLARMAGQWTVTKKFYPRGGGQPAVASGECTQHMIHGGRFLQSDFVFHEPSGGGDTTGTGIIGFDVQTGKFTSYWVDSRSTRISIRQSETPFDGQTIVLFAKSLGDPGPSSRRSRTVSTLDDNDRHLLHRQFSDNAGEEPRLVMELDMKRTK